MSLYQLVVVLSVNLVHCNNWPTYRHPDNAQQLCYMCPPMYYFKAPCEIDRNHNPGYSACTRCTGPEYSARWNIKERCWAHEECGVGEKVLYDGKNTGPLLCACDLHKTRSVEDGECVDAVPLTKYQKILNEKKICEEKKCPTHAVVQAYPSTPALTSPAERTTSTEVAGSTGQHYQSVTTNCEDRGSMILTIILSVVSAILLTIIILLIIVGVLKIRHLKNKLKPKNSSDNESADKSSPQDPFVSSKEDTPSDPTYDRFRKDSEEKTPLLTSYSQQMQEEKRKNSDNITPMNTPGATGQHLSPEDQIDEADKSPPQDSVITPSKAMSPNLTYVPVKNDSEEKAPILTSDSQQKQGEKPKNSANISHMNTPGATAQCLSLGDQMDEAFRIVEDLMTDSIGNFIRQVLRLKLEVAHKITNSKKEDSDKLRDALMKWREIYGKDASVNLIISALRENDKNGIADKIEETLGICYEADITERNGPDAEAMLDRAFAKIESELTIANAKPLFRGPMKLNNEQISRFRQTDFVRDGLSAWKSKEGKDATVEKLLDCLENAELMATADSIRNLKAQNPPRNSNSRLSGGGAGESEQPTSNTGGGETETSQRLKKIGQSPVLEVSSQSRKQFGGDVQEIMDVGISVGEASGKS